MDNIADLEKTQNNKGFMHGMTPIIRKWLTFSKNSELPILDIGAAYGVATIPALLNDNKVVANDICSGHLEQLKIRTPKAYHHNLTLNTQYFPTDLSFQENAFKAVLCSHVLQFLDGDEVIDGINKIYNWLVKGGRLFLLTYTPYHETLKAFIPEYEKRKSQHVNWPGLIADKFIYNQSSLLSKNLPKRIHLYDNDILNPVIRAAGFKIIESEMFGGVENGVPEPFVLNKKEFIGIIAEK